MKKWFYFGINRKAGPGDEVFGISIGRLYFGYYAKGCAENEGFAFGWLDQNDALKSNWL